MGRRDRRDLQASSSRGRPARARRVIAVSERTKRDLVELYGVPPERITVTPHGVDPAFGPGRADARRRDYLLFVGAIQARKDPLAAARGGARRSGCRSSSPGPEREPALARELERRGADLRGYVEKDELAALYRGAAALVLPSRYEGFGLPVLEAMACGTPVVAAADPALREVAGDAARVRRAGRARRRDPAGARRARPARRRRPRARGGVHLGRDRPAARSTSTGRRSRDLGDRRLARPPRGARRVAAGARAAGRRDRR